MGTVGGGCSGSGTIVPFSTSLSYTSLYNQFTLLFFCTDTKHQNGGILLVYSLQSLKSPNLMTVELQNNLGDNIYIGTR